MWRRLCNASSAFGGAFRSPQKLARQIAILLFPAASGEGRFAFDSRREFLEENGDEFIGLNHSLARLAAELSAMPDKPEESFTFVRRAEELRVQLSFLMESEDPNTVFWIERRGGRGAGHSRHNVFLQATPIDVAPILRKALFSRMECVVLTSATLAVRGGFEYIERRLGWNTPAVPCCRRISITRVRPCSTFLPTCLIRARRSSDPTPRTAFADCLRSRVAAPSSFHQLRPDGWHL